MILSKNYKKDTEIRQSCIYKLYVDPVFGHEVKQ